MGVLRKLRSRARKGGLRAVKNYIRFLRLRKTQPLEVKSAYGVKLKGNWLDKTFRLYIEGAYGYYYSDYLKSISEEFVFIDIGANQGLYSLIASANKKCVCVHSFEPVNKTASLLHGNVQLNRRESVFIHEKAISNAIGEQKIKVVESHTGVASLRNDTAADNLNDSFCNIQCVNFEYLNGLLDGNCVKKVVVKVDVEGYEETVLNELIKCDWFGSVSDIFYEVDERWVDVLSVQSILQKVGFESFKKIGFVTPKKLYRLRHYDVHAFR